MASGRQVGQPRARAGIGSGGVVRRIDELGRIVIPVEIRRRLGIEVHDPLEIGVRGDIITLSPPHDLCVFCGSRSGLSEHHGRHICAACRIELAGGVISR
jgi:transcriptional pleiotropic regulator of transition state genes